MPTYVAILIAAALTVTSPAPPLDQVVLKPSASLDGKATWYDYHQGQAAAGSELKRFLGVHWRGQRVTVCARTCIHVTLTDSCGCPGPRVIDLDPRDFDIISDRSVGVVDVRVARATE